MRDLITGLAICLLLALVAALAAPYFIDWGSRRDEVSRQISAFTGQPLRIEGPIGLTLLPTPSLRLGHVTLAEGGALSGSIGRIKAVLAIPPLLRGQIRITEAQLQSGRLMLTPRAGAPVAAATGAATADVAVARLAVADTELTVVGADGTAAIFSGIEGTLEATALDGPFKGALNLSWVGERRTLRFSTGRITDRSLRLRAASENEVAASRAEFDGTVSWADGPLAVDGKVSASGNAPVALSEGLPNLLWRVQAQVKGTAEKATAEQVEIAVGHTDRQAVLSGAAELALAGGLRVNATLATRQVDLDRMLAGEDNRKPPAPEALVRQLLAHAAGSAVGGGAWPFAGSIDVSAGSLLAGGGVVAAPRVVFDAGPRGLRLVRAEGELPGRARLSFLRAREEGGPVSADIRDLQGFAAWFGGAPAPQGPAAAGLVKSMAIDGQLNRTALGFTVSDGDIRADEMRFTGRLDADLSEERPRLTAVLSADLLDIARLPDFSGGPGQTPFDIDLTLDAGRVRYNGAGAGAIRAVLSRKGDELRISELTVRDLGGASMRASGVLGGAQPRLEASVQAQQLEALLELLDKLLPNPAIGQLKARARLLAPANLTMAATPADAGRWRLAGAGSLGGTAFNASLLLEADGRMAAPDGLRMELSSPSPGPLARKLGLPAIEAPGAGPLLLGLTGGGFSGSGGGTPWSLKGVIGVTTIDASGMLTADPQEPFKGRITLRSDDLSPLAQTLLVTVPRVMPGQGLSLSAGIDLRGYRLTLRDISATAGGVPVTGEIAFNLLEFGRVAGQLRMPYFDAGLVAPLVLGTGPAPKGVGQTPPWSTAAFSAAAAVTLPGDLWIEAGQVRLGEGLTVEQSKFVLRFDNGLLFLDHGSARWGGAPVTAQGTLRRNGRSVSLAGRLAFAGASPFAQGKSDGEIEFTGVGDSPAQLVAALNGTGALRYRDVVLPALARTAFADIAAARERNDVLSRGAIVDRLRGSVRETLALPPGEARLTLAGGVLRAGPFAADDGVHAITAAAAYDLRNLTVIGRLDYAARSAPKGWTGPPPQAVLTWRGAADRPQLDVEADEFANGLTALAIQRETERIEALEQDQRERGFFNRRLRAAEDERRAEAERRRQEEIARQQEVLRQQRQRAEDAARAAQPAPVPLVPLLPLPEPPQPAVR